MVRVWMTGPRLIGAFGWSLALSPDEQTTSLNASWEYLK